MGRTRGFEFAVAALVVAVCVTVMISTSGADAITTTTTTSTTNKESESILVSRRVDLMSHQHQREAIRRRGRLSTGGTLCDKFYEENTDIDIKKAYGVFSIDGTTYKSQSTLFCDTSPLCVVSLVVA